MTLLRAIVLLCVLTARVGAQPQARAAQFADAVAAFERGDNARTISLLAAYERSHGTSPRLESLRALAFRDLGRPMEAHRALLVYFRLTARRDMSGSPAHADLRRLRTELLAKVEEEYKETTDSLTKAREEAADEIVEELKSTYASPAVRIASSSAPPEPIRQALARDPSGSSVVPSAASATGAQRALWARIRQSTAAMDFFIFSETFPNGPYADSARRKMMEIGDPAWNAVRDSFVPAQLRGFITANPNSPFRAAAAEREQLLVGIEREWEAILADDSKPDAEQAFESRYQWHPLATRAKQLREERTWVRIANVDEPKVFREFAAEFPESPRAALALARYAGIMQREFPALTARIAQYGGAPIVLPGYAATYTFHYAVNGPCSMVATRAENPSHYLNVPTRHEYAIDLSVEARISYGFNSGFVWTSFSVDSARPITKKRTFHSRNPMWGPYVAREEWQRPYTVPVFEREADFWIGLFRDVETTERFKADVEALAGYCASVKSGR